MVTKTVMYLALVMDFCASGTPVIVTVLDIVVVYKTSKPTVEAGQFGVAATRATSTKTAI